MLVVGPWSLLNQNLKLEARGGRDESRGRFSLMPTICPSVFWPKGCTTDGICYGWLNPAICVAGVLEVFTALLVLYFSTTFFYRMVYYPLHLFVLRFGNQSNRLVEGIRL